MQLFLSVVVNTLTQKTVPLHLGLDLNGSNFVYVSG